MKSPNDQLGWGPHIVNPIGRDDPSNYKALYYVVYFQCETLLKVQIFSHTLQRPSAMGSPSISIRKLTQWERVV